MQSCDFTSIHNCSVVKRGQGFMPCFPIITVMMRLTSPVSAATHPGFCTLASTHAVLHVVSSRRVKGCIDSNIPYKKERDKEVVYSYAKLGVLGSVAWLLTEPSQLQLTARSVERDQPHAQHSDYNGFGNGRMCLITCNKNLGLSSSQSASEDRECRMK